MFTDFLNLRLSFKHFFSSVFLFTTITQQCRSEYFLFSSSKFIELTNFDFITSFRFTTVICLNKYKLLLHPINNIEYNIIHTYPLTGNRSYYSFLIDR